MTEQDIMRSIMIAPHGARLFRNNVGTGWTGNKIDRVTKPGMIYIQPGDVVVRNARPLHAGLCKGSHDLVGWRSLEINTEMIGRKLAVFCSLEVKTQTGKPSPDQIHWDQVVKNSGGLSGIVKSVEEAKTVLTSIENAKDLSQQHEMRLPPYEKK